MRLFALILMLTPAAFSAPADQPLFPFVTEPIPAPSPNPAPKPVAIPKLDSDSLFVVNSPTDCVVLASPANLVDITTVAGPLTIHGKFADSKGKVETRVYGGKVVSLIKAKAAGRVEILYFPVGATKADQVVRQLVDTLAGPIPPPNPNPKPQPNPNPKPSPVPVTPTAFRLVVVQEGTAVTPQIAAIYQSAALNAAMQAKGHKWRIIDQDVVGVDGKPPADVAAQLAAAKGKPIPQVFLVDTDGKTRYQGPLTTAADLQALITKYGG